MLLADVSAQLFCAWISCALCAGELQAVGAGAGHAVHWEAGLVSQQARVGLYRILAPIADLLLPGECMHMAGRSASFLQEVQLARTSQVHNRRVRHAGCGGLDRLVLLCPHLLMLSAAASWERGRRTVA
jgi:hypothetical protein